MVHDGGVPARGVFARHDSDGRLQIGPQAFASLRRHAQVKPEQDEAGGVLLGRHISGTDDVVIDRVTEPMPGDRQSRTRFIRARGPHQEAIDEAWRESGGTCTYLGEWHTHPESVPTPSLIDRAGWHRKLLFDRFTEPIFFVIVGTHETRVWEGRRGFRLILLRRVQQD